MEGAVLRFGGIPSEVLLNNAKALVEHHDGVSREVRSMHGYGHFRVTGASCHVLALRTGPGQRERTSAGSARSIRTPSQVAGLRTGPARLQPFRNATLDLHPH
ncbi:hypothetical protein BN77_p11653 [Rhizobium mesoamericanum STM3625]|uniref:Uncharacterized protein n=1 Tax=Rhizobium mesoamericanum STM3625 TaxID=1211777 RepID=K0Q2T5_9HYPH|nr:hypothetical protein BN77_p11653 [Rhizobium mesoamericanum STM3625]